MRPAPLRNFTVVIFEQSRITKQIFKFRINVCKGELDVVIEKKRKEEKIEKLMTNRIKYFLNTTVKYVD